MKRKEKTENAVTRVFDHHVQEYDSWYDRHTMAFQSEVEAIRSLLPPGNSMGIEVGMGTGRFAEALGIKEGVEPSAAMREMALQRGLEVMEGSAEKLPYRDLHFDFVLMAACIGYFDELLPAFKEANRVLKKGGSLIIGSIEKNSRIGKLYDSRKQENVFYRTAKFYTTEKILDELKRAGFSAYEVVQTLFGDLDDATVFEPARTGYDQGSFIVIRAIKK